MMRERVEAGDGTPVIVRTADASSARDLEAVGARLHGAAHPGVVQVLSSAATPDGGWELRTAHGGTPLSRVDTIEPRRLAVIGAGVATTLADLHEHGIVHGRLTAERILLGAHDRPTLCGFGGAAPPGGTEADVAALGRVLLDRVDEQGDARQAASLARRMRTVLEQAVDDAPARRPSMRRLAGALAELGGSPAPVLRRPGATRRDRPLHDRSPERGRRLGTWPQLTSVGLAIVVLALGAARWRTDPPGPVERAAPRSGSGVGTVTTSEPTASTPSTRPDRAAACARVEGNPVAGGATGIECPHALAIDGTTVTIDGQAFEVGLPSDVLAVGSWRCAGDATIALLRPATGEVFVFPAATDVEVTVRPLTTVPGATAFRTVALGPRCQELHVLDGSGQPTALELRPT